MKWAEWLPCQIYVLHLLCKNIWFSWGLINCCQYGPKELLNKSNNTFS
jgi:hypothetical protein